MFRSGFKARPKLCWRENKMKNRVAVYGSLRKGFYNHHIIEGSIFLGEDWIFEINLYDLGPYPGALMEQSDGVLVEVYEVSDQCLLRLDELEGFLENDQNSLYRRIPIESSYGSVWIYIYNQAVDPNELIESGIWH